jgi:RNA polymerase sigma factor (sigma-70 family)
MNEPLDDLLAQLCSGNTAAAERVFREYEPYLRKAVRRRLPPALRAKLDSADILQSVWADVFRTFREAGRRFVDADHLRAFLFLATRNRLIDRVRRHKGAEREEPLDDHGDALPSPVPGPSQLAQAGDLWERLLAACAPEHRPILRLRRQGYSLAEIAGRTGLHADSIRRILRALARRLAFAEQGPARREQG